MRVTIHRHEDGIEKTFNPTDCGDLYQKYKNKKRNYNEIVKHYKTVFEQNEKLLEQNQTLFKENEALFEKYETLRERYDHQKTLNRNLVERETKLNERETALDKGWREMAQEGEKLFEYKNDIELTSDTIFLNNYFNEETIKAYTDFMKSDSTNAKYQSKYSVIHNFLLNDTCISEKKTN